MSEVARLIAMLQNSAAQLPTRSQPSFPNPSGYPHPSLSPICEVSESSIHDPVEPSQCPVAIPSSLAKAFELVATRAPLPPQSQEPLYEEFKVDLSRVLSTLKRSLPYRNPPSSPAREPSDFINDLAIANCRRIFSVAKNPLALQSIANDFELASTANMSGRFPVLSTSNLPPATSEEASATASPARGTAMLNSIFKSVRVPEFRHKWQFWAEKGQQAPPTSSSGEKSTTSAEDFASRPKPLGDLIISVKEFYQHFNNIPTDQLKLRDSIHLFHLGVKPLWEDPRNARGGAWYFRVSKDVAAQFWHELCLLAVGDVLQCAVETKRDSFNDDICGLSYSVRWNAVQIAIWNRDADNEAGKEKLLAAVLEKLSEELLPKKDSYWYKAHKEHKGFVAPSS